MKIALNGATTMFADLETDIKAASAAGYELIEIYILPSNAELLATIEIEICKLMILIYLTTK